MTPPWWIQENPTDAEVGVTHFSWACQRCSRYLVQFKEQLVWRSNELHCKWSYQVTVNSVLSPVVQAPSGTVVGDWLGQEWNVRGVQINV